jgi:hypothetical protein
MPGFRRLNSVGPDVGGYRRAEFQNPSTYGLKADLNATFCQHFFHIPKTQRKLKIEPNRPMDDRWWKPVTGIANLFHPFLLSWIQQVRRFNVTMPFRRMRSLQKFVSVYASVHNHFNHERHIYSRSNFKLNRAVALSEWRQLGAAYRAASLSLQRLVRIRLTPPVGACEPYRHSSPYTPQSTTISTRKDTSTVDLISSSTAPPLWPSGVTSAQPNRLRLPGN